MTDLNDKKVCCDECGAERYKEIEILGTKRTVRIQCECEEKRDIEAMEQIKKNDKERIMSKCKNISVIDKKSLSETFENTRLDTTETKEMMKLGKKYCLEFEKVLKENSNLYLFGETGVGKSYLSNCIYNYLSKKHTVLMINMPLYLLNLSKGYSDGETRETEILRVLENVDLLVIDDLAREKINEWTLEKTMNIIEKRIGMLKPILINSNYSIDNLKDKYSKFDEFDRLADRIKGACLDVEYKGISKRNNEISNSWLV